MTDNGGTPYSPFGLASFGLSVTLIAIALVSGGALLLKIRLPYGNWPTAFLGLDVLCGGPAAVLIGLPLGLIGFYQKGKRKQFVVMGLILNLLFALGVLVLILILPLFVQY
jgi:hypothetical protein